MKWTFSLVVGLVGGCAAFAPIIPMKHHHHSVQRHSMEGPSSRVLPDITCRQRKRTMELNMFMGSDGGILGIGGPELATILLIGYFVLGPSDLYKLTKEVGKFIQNFRNFTTEATATFESSMESQLQLEEIRKAQRELTDAFNFRRSINVDSDSEAFSVNVQSERQGVLSALEDEDQEEEQQSNSEEEEAPKKKKKIRRRVRKKVVPAEEEEEAAAASMKDQGVPAELSIDDGDDDWGDGKALKELEEARNALKSERDGLTEEYNESEMLREERMERLKGSMGTAGEEEKVQQELASEVGYDLEAADDATARFQAQLNGSWNENIIAKTEELKPMETIMQQLALLEKEKEAADKRLQEEFKRREENEEKYYREKRRMLEEAVQTIQQDQFASNGSTSKQ